MTRDPNSKFLIIGNCSNVMISFVKSILSSGYQVRCWLNNKTDFPIQSSRLELVQEPFNQLNKIMLYTKDVDIVYIFAEDIVLLPKSQQFYLLEFCQLLKDYVNSLSIKRIVMLNTLMPECIVDKKQSYFYFQNELNTLMRHFKVPVIEIRCSLIISEESLVVKVINDLVEKLPVMLLPRWVYSKFNPIDIDDLLYFLSEAFYLSLDHSVTLDIGSELQSNFFEMIKLTAQLKKKTCYLISLPIISDFIAAVWIHIFTEVNYKEALKLTKVLKHPTQIQYDYFMFKKLKSKSIAYLLKKKEVFSSKSVSRAEKESLDLQYLDSFAKKNYFSRFFYSSFQYNFSLPVFILKPILTSGEVIFSSFFLKLYFGMLNKRNKILIQDTGKGSKQKIALGTWYKKISQDDNLIFFEKYEKNVYWKLVIQFKQCEWGTEMQQSVFCEHFSYFSVFLYLCLKPLLKLGFYLQQKAITKILNQHSHDVNNLAELFSAKSLIKKT